MTTSCGILGTRAFIEINLLKYWANSSLWCLQLKRLTTMNNIGWNLWNLMRSLDIIWSYDCIDLGCNDEYHCLGGALTAMMNDFAKVASSSPPEITTPSKLIRNCLGQTGHRRLEASWTCNLVAIVPFVDSFKVVKLGRLIWIIVNSSWTSFLWSLCYITGVVKLVILIDVLDFIIRGHLRVVSTSWILCLKYFSLLFSNTPWVLLVWPIIDLVVFFGYLFLCFILVLAHVWNYGFRCWAVNCLHSY